MYSILHRIDVHGFTRGLKGLFLLLVMTAGVCLHAQQTFDIQAFSDSTKYGWQDYRVRENYRNDLAMRQSLLQIYEMEAQSINANLIKSAIIPGWGQYGTKNSTKATVILSIELISLISSIYFYDKAMTNYDLYKKATQIDEINNYYSKAQTPYQYSLMMLGLAGVVWGYSVYDVIASTNDYNAELWDRIVKRQSSSKIQVTPNGIEVRF